MGIVRENRWVIWASSQRMSSLDEEGEKCWSKQHYTSRILVFVNHSGSYVDRLLQNHTTISDTKTRTQSLCRMDGKYARYKNKKSSYSVFCG